MRFLLSALLLGLCFAGSLSADSVVYTGADLNGRAAEVMFSTTDGSDLTVTLTNTSASDALVPVDILTAVLFSTADPWLLATGTATIGAGSTVIVGNGNDVVDWGANDDVGGEWAYRDDVVAPGLPSYGISSTGLDDVFGPTDRFGTFNREGPESPDGLQYGIVTSADNPATANGGLGKSSVISDTVVFTFSNNGVQPLRLSDITGVFFQYGTSKSEPRFQATLTRTIVDPPPVPEPASAVLFGLGGLCLASRMRRRQSPATQSEI